MRLLPTYLFLLVLVPCCLSCRDGKTEQKIVPASVAYEDSVYCFNQRTIVTLSGKKGLIDDDGLQILAPEWDSIEFLDDEVALLSKSGKWFLCTCEGRVFAETEDKTVLEDSFRQRLDRVRDADYRYWEQVLEQLEMLGEDCLSSRSHRPDGQMLGAYSKLQTFLESPSGEMSEEQKARFERIVRDFNTHYRR